MNLKLASVIFILAVFSISIISLTSAQYLRAFPSFAQGSQYTPYTGTAQFPLFDRSMCEAGQDFILQVDPLGCNPTVVRSDLLEDQDVAVFCPVTATQLNPLININTVNNIYFTFEGNHSQGVKGIVYFPARAALGKPNVPVGQVNQPILNNIGYAVIILQRQPNESAIPNFFEGNLTARIRYDIQNAFGVGRATYYLPVLNEAEWEKNYVRYEFWNGRGYLRADSVNDSGAGISVYSDMEDYGPLKTGTKRIIASVSLNKGELSGELPIPGFNFCLGTMKLKLTGIENPNTRVKLRVNEDVFEVVQGERFLDNKCQVTKIDKQGVIEKAFITCQEDEKTSPFQMSINPRVKLTIGGVPGEFSVGQMLYSDTKDTTKSVYLVYIDSTGNVVNQQSLFVYTASLPGIRPKLTDEELSSMASAIKKLSKKGDINNNNIADKIINAAKGIISSGNRIWQTVQGRDFKIIYFGQPSQDIFGKTISLDGFADAVDSDFSGIQQVEEPYTNAMRDYEDIRESYSNQPEGGATLGERALSGQIELTYTINKTKTAKDLCDEFQSSYPNSENSNCDNLARLSSIESSVRDVVINGRVKRIVFDGIIEPDFEDFGATIDVLDKSTGKPTPYNLTKNEIVYLNDGGEYISLVDISKGVGGSSVDSVTLQVSLKRQNTLISSTGQETLRKGFPNTLRSSNYQFTLTEVNINKVAKVSVEPNINYAETRATFPFKIGIEKRGIQLSPEKTRERIASLNKTLETWRKLSDNLGNVVSGFKAACLGVGTTLTIKNFFSNLGGKGIARQAVMRAPDVGWVDKCTKEVSDKKFNNIDSCLLAHSNEIDQSVDAYANAIEKQNEADKALRQSPGVTENGAVINNEYIKAWNNQVRPQIQNSLTSRFGDTITISTPEGNKPIPISNILSSDRINANTVFITQLRDLQANAGLLSSSDPVVKAIAEAEIRKNLGSIWVNSLVAVKIQDLQTTYGIPAVVGATRKLIEIPASNVGTFGQSKFASQTQLGISSDTKVLIFEDAANSNKYLLVLNANYVITATYLIGAGDILTLVDNQPNPLGLSIKKFDSSTYNNRFIDPKIRYYEAGTYKGLPAIVPFDIREGWYVAVKSSLPIGGALRAFDDSGAAASYYICNVGTNGREEFSSGVGDDICRGYVRGASQPPDFPGLSRDKAVTLMSRAENALAEASRAYKSGLKDVYITSPRGDRQKIQVGEPYTSTPDIQCQDFMSPTDCNLLFNVCDPVVCPSSRCDLGGTYPVKDVVQSGIVGGIVLCLPNFPEVKVPVCLSAIHAGVEGLVSVLDSYQQCLQTSLKTGQTIGICDEINSIYMCDFFWRQSIPIVKIATSQGLGSIFGQGSRGGGEYLGVADAWQQADNSINYFTQYYATDSFRAFKARSIEDVGTEICKNFVSVSYPQGGNFFDRLIAPDSPSQFYGRFDEIPFTTATNPPTSQYKVFYHIYAGKDIPAYYQVYLRGGGTSFYQDAFSRRIVAQGFIRAGEYATETRDLTAPAGFREMCIVVNAQEECGFKQVTTDFGINYVTEQFLASEAKRTDITSEAVCVSGTTNLLPLLSPNIQGGVEEAINPAIYNRGITRVCATDNPGKTTSPTRWQSVGYCGDPSIKCWIDTDSVKNAIKSTSIENATLQAVTPSIVDQLTQQGYLDDSAWQQVYSKIKSENNPATKIELINQNIAKIIQIPRRGLLIIERADAYKQIAVKIYQDYLAGIKAPALSAPSTPGTTETTTTSTPGTATTNKNCGDCGGLWYDPTNYCDEDDCKQIGRDTGKNCVFEDRTFPLPNLCTEKTVTQPPREIRNDYNFDSNIDISQMRDYVAAASQDSYVGRMCNCGANCNSYATLILEISKKHNIPDPVLLLSLMMQESSCNYNAASESSYGLMQIKDWQLCQNELGIKSINDVIGTGNINRNIECGAVILKKKYDQYRNGVIFNGCSDEWQNVKYFDWEAAIRGYNGLGCNEQYSEQDHFVTEVMRRFQCLKGESTGSTCD